MSGVTVADLRVIAITDNLRDGVQGLVARVSAARQGGATMVHVRLPDDGTRTLVGTTRALVESLDIPVLVHDRLDVALAAEARGVHLGVGGISAVDARRLAPPGFIIGVSAGSAEDVRGAAGSDYLAIGPVFTTALRGSDTAIGIDGLKHLAELAAPTPVVAVGGISVRNAPEVISAGACGVALIAALLAADDPAAATRAIRAAIGT